MIPGACMLSSPERRHQLRRAVGLMWATLGASGSQLAQANSLKLGLLAPTLTLHTLEGATISSTDLLGTVVIATFWATWCEPCREELPMLSEYAAQHATWGLQVLGFSLDLVSDLPKVRQLARTLSFPVGLLGNPWVAGYGRIWKLPVSFVIARNGTLAHNGWDEEDPALTPERLKRVVDPLLAPGG